MRAAFFFLLLALSAAAKQPLLVISVDGLDQRDLDSSSNRIPHIRKLMAEGQAAAGVTGVVPTITWPSHTTLITGVTPAVHGIEWNRMPSGDYPWGVEHLKVRTLLDAAHDAGLKTAVITWPVTVDAPVDYNLPEYFKKRRGGAMDLASIESKAKPRDLVERITKAFPSFPQEWMDDRTRTLAVVYLLKHEHPDLILVHLVDLDSEEHENGPFTREAHAMLEYIDELIGQMMDALPRNAAVALVSDHGFERVDQVVNVARLSPEVRVAGGVALAETPAAATALRAAQAHSDSGVGREISKEEVLRFAPAYAKAAAVFEPAPHTQFSAVKEGPAVSTPKERGEHGFWPTRYQPVFVLWGTQAKAAKLPVIEQTSIAARLAAVAGIAWKQN